MSAFYRFRFYRKTLMLGITAIAFSGLALTFYAASAWTALAATPDPVSPGGVSVQLPETPLPPPVLTPTSTITGTLSSELSPTPIPSTDDVGALPITATQTLTPTIELSLDITGTDPISGYVYLPVLHFPGAYLPESRTLFCSAPGAPIPDGNPTGVSHAITINDQRIITDLDIYLNITHTWVGDLSISLTHKESGKSIQLIDRPGVPSTTAGCGNNNIKSILDDEMSAKTENKCITSPAAVAGSYIPQEKLVAFDSDLLNGRWTLTVIDHSANDTGSLISWCLFANGSLNPAPPPPPPTPPNLPSQRIINGVTGQGQARNLDCESRSAVDWARYFGKSIDEIAFFFSLPVSTNPDKGFVGNVNGTWGQIPPNDYGVHAEPIAAKLRDRGLDAYAHKYMSWDGLRAEIAAGRPVIVWIIGASFGQLASGAPEYFTPPDGLTTIVARYEHTVIVTGYTSSRVYYLNGGTIYDIPVTQFLDSWSALGNMAVTASP